MKLWSLALLGTLAVAHSTGGLVSRGYLLISTPWGGHKGAETGVKRAPVVVRVWRDMVPGSEYQLGESH